MSTLIEQANEIGMTELQLNAVMGSLLGDGAFAIGGPNTVAIRWNHSSKQDAYVQNKYQTLREFATRPPVIKPNPGYGDFWSLLTLRALGIFRSLHAMMHPRGCKEKYVTWEYLTTITHPIALAWWFMDDGSRDKGYNRGHIHTNGFSKDEVVMLSNWLRGCWRIPAYARQVTHSSTGNTGWILYLPVEGYVRLCELAAPYVPESMKYKLTPVYVTCPVCGSQMPLSNKFCCSPKCAEIYHKTAKQLYYQQHLEHFKQKSKEWKAAHREQINAAARERYASLTEEKKKALREYANMWRHRRGDEYRAYRRAYRAAMKSDPEYQRKLKEERARYFQRLKADPERYARRLELARNRKHTDSYREKSRIYLHNHRMEKRAQDPEVLKKYQEYMAHREELANMTPEERAAYDREYQRQAYQKKLARMTPEELTDFRAKQNELSAERWANKTPEQHAKLKAAQKRMRDSWTPEIRAKKAAQKKASYERKMAEIKADPEKYAAFLQKARADYQKRQAAKKAKQTQQRPVYAVDPDLGFDF